MAQSTKTESAKATESTRGAADHVGGEGRRAADQAVEVAREASDNVKTLNYRGIQNVQTAVDAADEVSRIMADKAIGGLSELGNTVVDLLKEQTEHNLETLQALYGAVDWDQVVKAVDWRSAVQIQVEFMRSSWTRAAHLTQRYLEVSQSMMTSNASVLQRQAKKAA